MDLKLCELIPEGIIIGGSPPLESELGLGGRNERHWRFELSYRSRILKDGYISGRFWFLQLGILGN